MRTNILGKKVYIPLEPYRTTRRLEIRILKQYLQVEAGDVLCDIGSGTGYWTEQITGEAYTVGLDIMWRDTLVAAQEHKGPHADFVQGNAERMPFADGAFTKIFGVCSVEHIPDNHAAFNEFNRCLRPGGVLALTLDSLNYDGISNARRDEHAKRYSVEHLYDMDATRTILDQHGFDVTDMQHLLCSPPAHYVNLFVDRYRRAHYLMFPLSYPLTILSDKFMGKRDQGLEIGRPGRETRLMGVLPVRRGRRLSFSWVKYTSRSPNFARALGADHHFIYDKPHWGPAKYLPRTLHMLGLLLRERPDLVIAMSPPLVNAVVAWAYTVAFNARLVTDSHSGAFNDPKWSRFEKFNGFILRRAVFSVVHNDVIRQAVEELGGRAVVVSDLDFEMPPGEYPLAEGASFCVVSAYAFDEPLDAVWEAARRVPDATFYVTGNARKAPADLIENRPANVVMTGYVSNEAYAGLVRGVTAVIALTTRDNTMQRGGSEAISAGRPVITSDWPVLKEAFYKGTVHCDNTPEGIVAALGAMTQDLPRYEREIAELKTERAERFAATLEEIEGLLSERGGARP